MMYVVVEKKDGRGYIELLQCSEELHAKQMVEELYRESQERGERREFKYIELPGTVTIPEDKPREKLVDRLEKKIQIIVP